MKISITVLLSMASLLFVANAQAAEVETKQGRECLFASQPSSWHVLDDQQLVLWGTAQRDAYLVKLFAPVSGLRFAISLAVIDSDHNGMICGGSNDKISVPDPNMPSFPTPIDSMRKVDDAELVALGEQYKTKLISDKRAAAVKNHDKKIHD